MYIQLVIFAPYVDRTVGDSRMTRFFGQDFTTERWKKAALKNAFALLSKQRFIHAAAFFLLGDKLWDACEVCVSRLGDLQLALVVTRLYEGDGGPVYERLLKQSVLGISEFGDSGEFRGGRSVRVYRGEPNPNPFLRSIACWLLQDYSVALETLLRSNHPGDGEAEGHSDKSPDPTIFNFYFFLRSHPLLIRRNRQGYRSQSAKSNSLLPPRSPHDPPSSWRRPISSVGEEPLTALERNLLFTTAYHHLNHGCPLLALDVLAKLPKSASLGADLNQDGRRLRSGSVAGDDKEEGVGRSGRKGRLVDPSASLTGMIQSGTLRGFDYAPKSQGHHVEGVAECEEEVDWSRPVTLSKTNEEEDVDWLKPLSAGALGEDEEEVDWSKPITAQMLGSTNGGREDGEREDDIDWSQPVSAQFDEKPRSPSLSPPNFSGRDPLSPPTDSAHLEASDESDGTNLSSLTTLSSQGLFVLSLAEQLQYNACLSILTEELITIHLPPCCEFLWEEGGRGCLPLLPLSGRQTEKGLASQTRENAFEKTVLRLREKLVVWLRREMGVVKDICGFGSSRDDLEESSEDYVPAGYDLLTTLMNYASLHAGTSPSLVTIKLELMHLMNTLLPWSTRPTTGGPEGDGESGLPGATGTQVGGVVPTCAVDPSQLPILTSCSLPANHLTNLTLHLRLMSASIIEVLANHTRPPISSKPLPHVEKVFELCCALSSSITVCLSPINITEIAPDLLLSPSLLATNPVATSGISTPVVAVGTASDFSQSVEPRQRERASPKVPQRGSAQKYGRTSSSVGNEGSDPPATPNSKPSRWPGVPKWPKALQSDEGKDPTPMSLILAECCIATYLGLLSVAWSEHSISDLLLLLKNTPSLEFWYQAFGGGVDMKRGESVERGRRGGGGGGGGGERSAFMKKVDNMKRGIKMLRRAESQTGESAGHGLFVAPKKTLLELFLDRAVS